MSPSLYASFDRPWTVLAGKNVATPPPQAAASEKKK
jgi:hypothetical protein